MRRHIVIGDVHGCIDEMRRLLFELEFKKDVDDLIFAGDLIDRGPDSPGVVRMAREMGARSVMGNHEEKAVRWARHERTRGLKKNPMQVRPGRAAEWAALSEEDRVWMAALPAFLRVGKEYIVVHAGLESVRPPEEQKLDRVCRMRYVDADSGEYKSGSDPREVPENTVDWMEAWKGPESVIYGHAVHDREYPRINTPQPGVKTFGIETGVVFGGKLTAMVIDPKRTLGSEVYFHQVQAAQVYFRDDSRGKPGVD